MASRRSALHRDRVKLFLRILATGAAIGAAYGAMVAPPGSARYLHSMIGAAFGLVIAGSISGIAIFVLREGTSSSRLSGLPFIAVVAFKTLLYGTIVTGLIAGTHFVVLLTPLQTHGTPLDRHALLITIGFSLAMTVIFVIVLQATALLGRRTFGNLVLGRYYRPRAERRFFLFVDVVGSTAIAERLGPLQGHRFLAAVFSATAEPIAACRGEIYQYVGDEIVVTWTEAEGGPEGRPLHCYFEMKAALAERAAEFTARFGAEPDLRAALHLGEVIAGEVGEQRRAIVYHGDVMNTAARLEQATRELGARFIASDDAVQALGAQAELDFRDLGALALRGRREPIRAWVVELRM